MNMMPATTSGPPATSRRFRSRIEMSDPATAVKAHGRNRTEDSNTGLRDIGYRISSLASLLPRLHCFFMVIVTGTVLAVTEASCLLLCLARNGYEEEKSCKRASIIPGGIKSCVLGCTCGSASDWQLSSCTAAATPEPLNDQWIEVRHACSNIARALGFNLSRHHSRNILGPITCRNGVSLLADMSH